MNSTELNQTLETSINSLPDRFRAQAISNTLPPLSNRNEQGHLQDRATRLLMEQLSDTKRKIRE